MLDGPFNLPFSGAPELLERVQHLEYATVAEQELEKLKEQLVGDLADMMAGRLRGEDDS